MNKKLALLFLTLFVIQSIAVVVAYQNGIKINEEARENPTKPRKIIKTDEGLVLVYRDKIVKIAIGKVEAKQAVTGDHYPGGWLNTHYNYRINVTLVESEGLARDNWPVDVYVTFDPWANRQGITVMDSSGNNVTFQIWNTTGNTTHIASATITFLADIPASGTAEYYIYYDTQPVGKPSFPTQVTLSISTDSVTGEPIYTVSSALYSKVVLAPGTQIGSKYVYTGGKILEIDEASTGLNLYNSPMNEPGISRNPSLYNPYGDANMTYQPENRFVDQETQNGPIFIAYKVINSPIYDTGGNLIAKANVTYRFFKWGWLVESYVKWLIDDPDMDAEYWFGMYTLDQDDGTDVSYDRVATSDGTTYVLGEGLPSTRSQVDKDWGKVDLTNKLRAFITPILTENHQYTVTLTWSGYVDLDLFIYSESGLLIEGYDSLWDKIDGFVVSQDYTESEQATATANMRWIIVVLAYLSEGDSASFTVTVHDDTDNVDVASFSGSFASSDFVYSSRYDAYCNYYYSSYPDTIDESKEGDVDYRVGGWAKRYFADDELVPFILHMPKQYGDDYYIRVNWDLEYSVVHYHIFNPDGTEWTEDTSGNSPPLTNTLYPPSGGDYVIIVHYYDGSYYDADDQSSYDDINVELYFEPPFAETEDYSGSGSWEWVTFYHHYCNRSIGFVNVSIEASLTRTATAYSDVYWGNKGEGPSTDEDYIMWALRFGGVSAKAGEWLHYKIGVVLSDKNDYSDIQYIAERLRSPIQVSTGSIERFTLKLTINVVDGDNGPVVGATVKLINKTSGVELFSGTTGGDGRVIFDVPRYDNYTLNVTLVSAGQVYTIVQDKDYSNIAYTQFLLEETYQFPNLVRIIMQANDTENRTLQDAIVRFDNGTLLAEANTNLSGYIDVYIPKGVWNLTIKYKYDYDRYNLTYVNGTFVKNISGLDVANVTWSQINITTGQRWILIDLVAAAPPPLTIKLEEGSYSYDVYWGEYVYVKVSLRSLGTLVDGDNNVTWTIQFANNNSPVGGYVDRHANIVSLGIYDVNLSSGELFAGYTYNLIIDVNKTTSGGKTYFVDANGNIYQAPQPLVITITVKPRPTSVVVDTLTSNIYWDEKFYVKVYYKDALNDSYITGATATIEFSGPDSFSEVLSPVSDYYELTIDPFTYSTGAYTLTIRISKGNYSEAVYTTTLLVNDRPTEVFAQSYVEIAWSIENYNVTVWYNDSRRGVLVTSATTSYDIYDSETQELVDSGTLIETSQGYIFSIPRIRLGIGTFTAKITLSKQYYEEKSFTITIVINPRSTYVSSNTTAVEIIWNETAWVLVSYYDNEYSPAQKIANASATFKVKPVGEDTVVYSGRLSAYNDDYLLAINFTENLSLGNYKIEVTLFKANYTSQQLTIDLIIDAVPTVLVSSQSSVEVEWGLNITIDFTYNRTDKKIGVIEATNKTYKIYYNDTLVLAGELIEIGNGTYRLILNTTAFVNETNPTLGTYVLKVFLGKPYHENQTLTIPITVDEVSMQITASTTEVSLIWGYLQNVTIYYNRTRDGAFISSANYKIVSTPNATGAFTWLELSGRYILTINTTNMLDGQTYTVNVTVYKQFHQARSVIITVEVKSIPTVVSASLTSATTEYGLNLTIDLWYNRTDTSPASGVEGATGTYDIKNGSGLVILSGDLIEIGGGEYQFVMNSTVVVNANSPKDVGTYTIYVYFNKTHYESGSIVITWTIEIVDTSYYAQPEKLNVTWGEIAYVDLFYTRVRDGAFVSGANSLVGSSPSAPETAFVITELSDKYQLMINTTQLNDAETYVLTITLSKQYYEEATITVQIDVLTIPTVATASETSIEIEWGLNISVWFWYNRSDTLESISDADNHTFEIYYNGTLVLKGTLAITPEGKYQLELNTTTFVNESNPNLGVYTLCAIFEKTHYGSQVIEIPVLVKEVDTLIYAQPDTISTIWGYIETSKIYYTMRRNGQLVKVNTSTEVIITVSPTLPQEATSISFEDSYYQLTIDTSYAIAGNTYYVNVSFEKLFYKSKWVVVTVYVDYVPTVVVSSVSSLETEFGVNISVWFWYNRTDTTEGIEGATTSVEVLNGSNAVVWSGSLEEVGYGNYSLILNSSIVVLNNNPPELGTYTLKVSFSKTNYKSQTVYITWTIKAISVTGYAQPANISMYWGYVENISIYYIRKRDDKFISGATHTIEMNPDATSALRFIELTDRYVLEINSTLMQDGVTYTINLTLSKQYYDSLTLVIRVDVKTIPTVAVSSLVAKTSEFGENLSVWFWYNRTDVVEGIEGATVSVTVTNSTQGEVPIIISVVEVGGGNYTFTVNSSDIVLANSPPKLGVYTITVHFSKEHFEEAVVEISWEITEIHTNYYAQPDKVNITWGNITTIDLYFNRERDDSFVKGAIIRNVSDPEPLGPAYAYEELSDRYRLTINSSYLEDSTTYTLTVYLEKAFYENATIQIRIDVNKIPTTIIASLLSATLYYGYMLNVDFWYNRTDTGAGISGAITSYTVLNESGIQIYSGTLSEVGAGKYTLSINTSTIIANNVPPEIPSSGALFSIDVLISKEHYEEASVVITLRVMNIPTLATATTTNISLIWSENATVQIYYNRSDRATFIPNANFAYVIKNATTGQEISVPSQAFVLYEGNNAYLLNITTRYLAVDKYVVEITFFANYFENATISIYVNVLPIKTYAYPSVKSATVEYPENFTFKVWYYTDTYNITDANATYTIDYGGTIIDSGNLTFNATDNSYELFMWTERLFNLSGSNKLPVSFTIYIYLKRDYHESKQLTLSFTIEPMQTILTISQKSVTIRYGQYVVFWMNYTDVEGRTPLSDANATYVITYTFANGTTVIVRSGNIPFNSTKQSFYLIFNTTEIINASWPYMEYPYEIRVRFEKYVDGNLIYEPQEAVLTVTVAPMEANLEVSSTSVTIQYGENWTFWFNYTDVAENKIIIDANATFRIIYNSTVVLAGTIGFNGSVYYLTFNSTQIINESWPNLGTYTLYVKFEKLFYETEEKIIAVTVEPRTTYVEAMPASTEIEYEESFRFNFRYIDVATDQLIEGANATFIIYYGASIVLRGNISFDGTYYYLIFNSTQIINASWPYLGTYSIYVTFEKLFYKEVVKVVSITVNEISTVAYAQPENITITWGLAPTVLIYYNRTKDGRFIDDANVQFNITPEVPEGAITIELENVYTVHIDSSKLSIETYILNVTLSKEFYETQTLVIRIDVVPIPTYMLFAFKSAKLEYGESITVKVWYIAKLATGDQFIVGADLNLSIVVGGKTILSIPMIFNSTDDSYEFVFNSTEIIELANVSELPTVFNVYINARKSVYQPQQNKVVTITVEPVATTVLVSSTDITAEWGQLVNISIRIIRNKTLAPVRNVSYVISGLPNDTYEMNVIDDSYVLFVNTTLLEQLNKSYVISIEFSKPYYVIRPVTITLTVTKVSIDLRLGTDIPKEVYKMPITEEHKKTMIDVGVYHKGMPVNEAKVFALVYSVDAGINKTIYGEPTKTPGQFRITIDWGEFHPGFKYTIKIGVESVKLFGRWIPVDKIVYKAVHEVVLMDYLYGSTKITIPIVNKEVYAPNMILYPIEATVFLLSLFAGYKIIGYLLTPPEVREINKLLKMIEKGIFEYKAPSRKAFILDLLASELGVEVDKSKLLEEEEG